MEKINWRRYCSRLRSGFRKGAYGGCLALLLLGATANAEDWRVMELQKMSLELTMVGAFKDSYFPQDKHQKYDKGLAAVFDLELLNGIYWNNKVMTLGNESQVRTISWEWDLAIKPHDKLELFYYHHSQHVLDEAPPLDAAGNEEHFPLRDMYGLRINFYDKSPRRGWWK